MITWRLLVILIGFQTLVFLIASKHKQMLGNYDLKFVEEREPDRIYLPERRVEMRKKELVEAEYGYWEEKRWRAVLQADPTPQIIYNRVARCGSRAVYELMKMKSKERGFAVALVRAPPPSLKAIQAANFTESFMNVKKPLVYIRHMLYLDFSLFERKPIYINLIRDPYERLVSRFYYEALQAGRNESYDVCIKRRDKRCWGHNIFTSQLRFFCGYDEICGKDPMAALEKAKKNVAEHYLVVGVAEQMGGFLKVLEDLVPSYFSGLSSMYDFYGSQLKEKMKNRKVKIPNNLTEKLVRENLLLEYKFYHYVEKRFKEQMRILNKAV